MTQVKEFVTAELAKLDKGIVATPKTQEDLLAFARANNGAMDVLLVMQAMQFGIKIALENVSELIATTEK